MQPQHVSQETVHGGRVVLSDLSFEDGQCVEVAVAKLPSLNRQSIANVRRQLRGQVERYDDPFEPAAPPEDWQVLR